MTRPAVSRNSMVTPRCVRAESVEARVGRAPRFHREMLLASSPAHSARSMMRARSFFIALNMTRAIGCILLSKRKAGDKAEEGEKTGEEGDVPDMRDETVGHQKLLSGV